MKQKRNIAEIYVSVDIEADGVIPGPYSMVSIGASIAGWADFEGEHIRIDDPEQLGFTFYAELKPISDDWDPQALAVGKLKKFDDSDDTDGRKKRAYLTENGQEPKEAMEAFNRWIDSIIEETGCRNVVFMEYPGGYDWMFTYWYLQAFTGRSPFGHSKKIGLKSYYAGRARKRINQSVKAKMPRKLFSKRPHTHTADDDAIEQGIMGMNILRWNGE